MKIRFNSSKENNPVRDGGASVLYAPGKRTAFKLRWYLILFLVASPVLFFAGKLAWSAWVVEVPAQIIFSMVEVRSRDAGQVARIHVQPGQSVSRNQLLLELDNPEWRFRLNQLRAIAAETANLGYTRSDNLNDVLTAQLERAEQRLATVSKLLDQGAATRGEVTTAADERDRKLAQLLELQQRERQASSSTPDVRAQGIQKAEEEWLQHKLQALTIQAKDAGVVAEVLVQEGENVGPGTLLMRLRSSDAATIYAYIDLAYADYAQAGQALRLHMPDGSWIGAEIKTDPDMAQTIPADIREAFSAQKRGLLVRVQTNEPIPDRWLVNQLPLEARFSHKWPEIWPWN
jgi:multidrug resistance efflux pump